MKILCSLAFMLGLLGHSQSLLAQTDSKPTTVAILLYPGVELLDFAGPLEVFSLMKNSRVFTVAAKPGPLIVMKKSLTVTPDYAIAQAPQVDILVVPGAASDAIMRVTADTTVINWIRRTTAQRQLTMSVCTGAYVLAKADLLTDRTVTTHWASTEMLQQMVPNTQVMEHARFVDDGNLLTTAGVSAGIDGALWVVARLRGEPAARAVAEIIEYDRWNPESGLVVSRQPKTARPKKAPTATTSAKAAPARVTQPATVAPKAAVLATDGLDPVCQMSVPKGTERTAMFGGKQYGFCSGICQKRFAENPAKYTPR